MRRSTISFGVIALLLALIFAKFYLVDRKQAPEFVDATDEVTKPAAPPAPDRADLKKQLEQQKQKDAQQAAVKKQAAAQAGKPPAGKGKAPEKPLIKSYNEDVESRWWKRAPR